MTVHVGEDSLLNIFSHVDIKQIYVCDVVIFRAVKGRAGKPWLVDP